MSKLYDEMKSEMRKFVSDDFHGHQFDENRLTVTDGSKETYQGRYDICDDTMVFIEKESEHAEERWYIEMAKEKYTNAEYTRMFESHFSGDLEEFKSMYGKDWKKIALECAFENREL